MKTDRGEAVKWLCRLHPGAIYVICNALCRDVFELADRPNNLYLVHGMGQALAVGIGIAQNTEQEVVVLDGDGNAVMGAAMWTMLHRESNLTYYVLVNGAYVTTGGQPVILPVFEPDDMMVVNIEMGKIDRPDGQEIRPLETSEGFICPIRTKTRFLAWSREKM